MFKIICLILVFFSIQTYTLKCWECGIEKKPETEDKRELGDDDLKGGICKDKNDNGTLNNCPQDKTFCSFITDGKEFCRCTYYLKYTS